MACKHGKHSTHRHAPANRLTQGSHYDENVYTFDAANRLTDIDGVSYVWDANGNLIQAGNRSLAYDHANRLISLTAGPETYSFSSNGLGVRLVQTVDGVPTQYTLDLNAGLTHVLSDGPIAFLYGLSRFGRYESGGWSYHLPDALGSVRQMADVNAAATFVQSHEPYGNLLELAGDAHTAYGFAGEWMDRRGLVHLRPRDKIGRLKLVKSSWLTFSPEWRPESLPTGSTTRHQQADRQA